MKKKSLIIILSVLAFIVLLVVLSSTIFCLKTVEINFYSNTINLTGKETEIIESANFKYNSSIFFINKNKYIKTIEEKNPYIKVLNIETNFPNKLSINCVERNELFALKGYENNVFSSYMILDNELKVLNNDSDYINNHNNAILVNIENEFTTKVLAGRALNNTYSNLIYRLGIELLAYNNNTLILKANFNEITLNYNSTNDVLIKMRSGTEIVLKDSNNYLTEKFMLALSTYNQKPDKTKGRITAFVNNEGLVEAYYT